MFSTADVSQHSTVSALINYDPRGAPLLDRKKFLRGPGGAFYLERNFDVSNIDQ